MKFAFSAAAALRVSFALAAAAGLLAQPASASGLGVSYNLLNNDDSLTDCQLAASVAFNNSGFKNVSTAHGKSGKTGAVFADIGAYQATIICDPIHHVTTVVVMGPEQTQTGKYESAIADAMTTH